MAVAALIVAVDAPMEVVSAGTQGQIIGANACKGKSDCGGKNGCPGQNACKGKGYLELSQGGMQQDPRHKIQAVGSGWPVVLVALANYSHVRYIQHGAVR